MWSHPALLCQALQLPPSLLWGFHVKQPWDSLVPLSHCLRGTISSCPGCRRNGKFRASYPGREGLFPLLRLFLLHPSVCLPPWLQRTWSSASIYPAATLDLRAGSCLAVPPLLDGQSQLPALSHICLPWKSQHVSDTDLLCWCPAWGAGCLAGSHHLALGRQSIAAGCVSLGTSPARPGDLTHSLLFPHGSLGTP